MSLGDQLGDSGKAYGYPIQETRCIGTRVPFWDSLPWLPLGSEDTIVVDEVGNDWVEWWTLNVGFIVEYTTV